MLHRLQSQLAELYEIDPPCAVERFLLTDKSTVKQLMPGSDAEGLREQLLIAEHAQGLDVALYLESRVIEELHRIDGAPPTSRQLDALWLAVEGVSHFLHLTWRAHTDRPISQLELELQAEIDKYLYTHRWLIEHNHTDYLPALHALLFDLARLNKDLDATQINRYHTANRYAAIYCRDLHRNPDGALGDDQLRSLRRFYRLSQYEKLRYIDSLKQPV